MATYKEIRGTQIEAVATDPSNPVEGQIWYNTTSNVLKGQATTTAGSWATGGALNTGRYGLASAKMGTQTAALAFGGGGPSGPPYWTTVTETYDGTSWTEVNDMSTARAYGAGFGTQTAAISAGGNAPPGVTANTESYNGTNWTEVNDLNNARTQLASGTGPSTAGLVCGGYTPSPDTAHDYTELWNGTNWTEVNDLNSSKYGIGGAGTSTAGLAYGGANPAVTDTETWNGTNWTEVNNLNNANKSSTGAGHTNTAAMCIGGGPAPNVKTELWNGTNWTETTDRSIAREYLAGAGTNAAGALAFGGQPSSPNGVQTEEWTGAGAGVTRTFDDS